MRIFLADFGDLLGPLLLVLFAVMPRLFGSKKKKAQKAARQQAPPPQPVEYQEPEFVEVEVEAAPPPPSPRPVQELPELAEVLQELLGRKQLEKEIPPPYELEQEPEIEGESLEIPVPAIDLDDHHALSQNLISQPVYRKRSRRRRMALNDRFSLRQAVLLREVLGPPRSLQPLEKWENGGS